MSLFKSQFQRAVNKGLKPGQNLRKAIRPFIFIKIANKDDALALVSALRGIPEKDDAGNEVWDALGNLVGFVEEANLSHESTRQVLASDGTGELVRIIAIWHIGTGVQVPFYGSRGTIEANRFASQHHRRAASGGSEARRS